MQPEDEVNEELEAVVEEAQREDGPERPTSRREAEQLEGGGSSDPQDGAAM